MPRRSHQIKTTTGANDPKPPWFDISLGFSGPLQIEHGQVAAGYAFHPHHDLVHMDKSAVLGFPAGGQPALDCHTELLDTGDPIIHPPAHVVSGDGLAGGFLEYVAHGR